MALKRQTTMLATFSMASMTDVIFLLLIFFMVTSTFVFPTALEVNLPQSSKQTALKPASRVFIDKEGAIYVGTSESEPQQVDLDGLLYFLRDHAASDEGNGEDFIAVYADEEVTYGTLVTVLDMGATHNLKMVLVTKPAPSTARPNTD